MTMTMEEARPMPINITKVETKIKDQIRREKLAINLNLIRKMFMMRMMTMNMMMKSHHIPSINIMIVMRNNLQRQNLREYSKNLKIHFKRQKQMKNLYWQIYQLVPHRKAFQNPKNGTKMKMMMRKIVMKMIERCLNHK